ncbi:putative Protein of unknown function (DUF971) [Trypanosoma vivax]|uniref:Gamma-butyrobetaine hydroxylase-like N-terminal domain-containing protein n=1 Tax=Trypanosoma vivax (strain Y486) TaxID=1055687 RepID=G0U563_TRYVY|nr:hypothetical protein TRVL_07330 [Trypanosoma vivax]KAH8616674.1 putative Protein of unknown function (DUF971) [Trypanosoma vivax]CCC51011.1 conserved hypothetical protein [Trypanosoma vivax Y486]
MRRLPSAFTSLADALPALQPRGRSFVSLLERLGSAVTDRLSNITETHMMPLGEKHVTEPRRPYPKRASMRQSLAERLAAQQQWRTHLIPSQVNLSKDKLYIELIWSAAAFHMAMEHERRSTTAHEQPTNALPGAVRHANFPGTEATASAMGITPLAKPEAYRVRFLAEFLRAYSPSTDVVGSDALIYGRRGITITDIVPVGSYAVRIVFSDGHSGGIYPYEYLFHLGQHKFTRMREYILRLRAKRKSRDPPRRAPSTRHMRSYEAAKVADEDVDGHRVAATRDAN